MSDLVWILLAVLLVWLGIASYLGFIHLRIRKLEREKDQIRRHQKMPNHLFVVGEHDSHLRQRAFYHHFQLEAGPGPLY